MPVDGELRPWGGLSVVCAERGCAEPAVVTLWSRTLMRDVRCGPYCQAHGEFRLADWNEQTGDVP